MEQNLCIKYCCTLNVKIHVTTRLFWHAYHLNLENCEHAYCFIVTTDYISEGSVSHINGVKIKAIFMLKNKILKNI